MAAAHLSTSSHDVAVRARGITRRFDGRTVLAGVEIDIAPGEFVALLGASGSGKTTLLRAFAGLDNDFDGTLVVPARRSVVFQDARLLPWARAATNVALAAEGKRVAERANAMLREVGLAGRERDWPKTLSGGEAQRVALARALVRQPDLLLLDEPFGALDALTRIKMHALLQQLCARYEPAVLLVTHDVDEAILLADRVAILNRGRIRLDEPVTLPSPRLRHQSGFARLRTKLLEHLGVDESAEGRHQSHLSELEQELSRA